ncbi:ETHYLENE INSENSITIVE 3-like 2 protein [Carex littledalei]|uniref:ETHYLENE INSENSITIVE 3-like 2 protein n=1 Tax=Carex littledalei TaxID=544730 RepID=A0A833QSJ2_9POAL|nr:ETHYLENE INSENSITIVE 3-like 2 protein [Carex littledalei]
MSSSSYSSSLSSSKQKKLSREEIQHRIKKLEAKIEKIEKRERGHETVENQFNTIMGKFNARGFVYSFHLNNGTIISGASDNLNDWWKGELRSYQENQQGTVTGTSSIHSNDSGANDQILLDHSSNNMTPAPTDSENDESQ